MKCFIKSVCLYLFFLLPLTTQAEPTGTVIFQYPGNDYNELWITNLENTDNARIIYKFTEVFYEIATQKEGPLVAFVADSDDDQPPFANDVYLFNRDRPHVKARNLTQKRFDLVLDVDISEAGDVIFTTELIHGEPPKEGVYLIPNRETEKPIPKVTLIREIEASNVAWSLDGKQIAYDIAGRSIYTFNIETRSILKVRHFGENPAFSPDGKKMAFFGREPRVIHVISLSNLNDTETIELEDRSAFIDLKWSSDGQYIIYTTTKSNFAAPVNGGPHIKLFEQFPRAVLFDWASPKGFPVEPIDNLTTLWGKLKQ